MVSLFPGELYFEPQEGRGNYPYKLGFHRFYIFANNILCKIVEAHKSRYTLVGTKDDWVILIII